MSRSFAGAFEVVSHLLTALVSAVQWALASPSPLVVIAMLSLLALLARRVVLAAFTLAAFALILSMDLWAPTVETLALVVVSTGVAVLIGIPLGIWCAVSAGISVTTRPVLDFMQTLPAYVYLIPAVFFFGVGLVPAIVATAIFAIPPAVRMTNLASVKSTVNSLRPPMHLAPTRGGSCARSNCHSRCRRLWRASIR